MRNLPSKQFGFWGAVIGGALGLAGGLLGNSARAREAEVNRDFQEEMSRTQYQRAVADLQAAGLNPMLAYSQGGNAVPQGAMAQYENVGASAYQGYAQALSAESASTAAEAASQQADTQAKIGDATIRKTAAEIRNLNSTDAQIQAITDNLRQEYQNLYREGLNKIEVGNQLRAAIEKIRAETANLPWERLRIKAQELLANTQAQLNQFDINAASKMDNIGRDVKQLAPVFDILRAIAGMRR